MSTHNMFLWKMRKPISRLWLEIKTKKTLKSGVMNQTGCKGSSGLLVCASWHISHRMAYFPVTRL